MTPLLPALFLALLTLWSGTFAGGATSLGAMSAHAALLAFCLLAGSRWRDPLALGRWNRWLVPGWILATVASWWAGPAHRAGILAVLLLPAFLLIPSAVANAWSNARRRQRGVAGVCLLLGLVAVVALLRWWLQGSPRAAMPLGHHNLLAGWLILTWPVGLVPLRRAGAWRAIAAIVAAVSVVALAASSSFLAACAFLIQALAAAAWWKRARPWLALALLVVWIGPALAAREGGQTTASSRSSTQLHRAREVVSGTDRSASARVVYARAGWEGFARRPLLGWGPGSTPWTVTRFVRPVSGLNPPSEIVGDLHSLPVQVAYELGLVGISLSGAILAVFAVRRYREFYRATDRILLRAACLGLVGGAVFSLGNSSSSILALPAAVAVLAGAALASGPPQQLSRGALSLGLGLFYVAPVVLLLLPYELAHLHYQRATTAPDPERALTAIRRAAEIDPRFPLYRARAAWLAADLHGVDRETAANARRAAEQGHELALLWLVAGAMAIDVGEPWAPEALNRARRLDPLSPLPAFHLLRARPFSRDAVDLGRFATTTEPRLVAAVFWERYPEIWARVAEGAAGEALTGDSAPPRPGASSPGNAIGPTVLLALTMDARPALSFSLFAFRRSPWPADVAPVELRSERLAPLRQR